MIYTEHRDAEGFLSVAHETLESSESVHGLMLGICLRLVGEPKAYGSDPYLATVESAGVLRVAAVMTPPYKLQLYSEEGYESAGSELIAGGLLGGRWSVPGVLAREGAARAFAATWCRRTKEDFRIGMRQRVYELREVVHPAYPPGEFRQAAASDVDVARQWARAFHRDCFDDGREAQSVRAAEEKLKGGDLFFWVDGVPRSMAATTRPTPHGAAISFVYTPPSNRRRGYGTAVVARLSQRLLDEGKQFTTLYTDLSNPTSNSIYGRVGYTGVADVVDVHFDRPARPLSA
jgi:predicted GNAT family acetyltransferase